MPLIIEKARVILLGFLKTEVLSIIFKVKFFLFIFSIWDKNSPSTPLNKEILSSTLLDFYQAESLISDKYDALFGHIKRLQESYDKFRNK